VSTTECHMLAIKTDGTLWTWGSNSTGELGDGTTIVRSSPGTTSGGGTTWCQAAAGDGQSSGIKTDGTLWAWARNGQGQLGDGTTICRSSPVTVAGGGTNWCQVNNNDRYNTVAVKTDGTLWTWGCGCCGALGEGSTNGRSSPGTTAGGGTNWRQASTGRFNGAAVKTDGTLWTWGYNGQGQLGNGGTTARCSPGETQGNLTGWIEVSLRSGGAGILISPPSI